MAYADEDLLGQKTMPRHPSAGSSFSLTKLVFTGAALFLAYNVALRLWKSFLLWRERSYKLATRRRHGIPDTDLRPFNVAYTDALMRQREEENKSNVKSKGSLRPQPPAPVEAQPDLRQRSVAHPSLRSISSAAPVPGSYASRPPEYLPPPPRSAHDLNHISSQSSSHSQRIVSASSQTTASSSAKPLSRNAAYTHLEDLSSDTEGKKRGWDDEFDGEHEAKKTRVEGDELIDGDEDAEFEDAVSMKRGSKRGIRDDEDSDSRGKRPRKVSTEKYFADQSMDVDEYEEEDEVTELKSPNVRGKKRDRAEAGSTFGGDDDESGPERDVDEGDEKNRRRRRKRRTVAKRVSEASYLRAKKHEQNSGDEMSDELSPSRMSSSRRKSLRSKRSSINGYDRLERSRSDISMDESTTSRRGREVGEEWESNGIKYKIGPNYQRLRQALVRKAKQKFTMPKDSQHPDRNANMQVYVECWLTEEEYQQAKADHMLAWQDSPQRYEDISLDMSQTGIQFPQSGSGKNLLWSGSASSTPTTMSPAPQSPAEFAQQELRYRENFRHSITSGLPITAFTGSTSSSVPTVKRIASTSRALSFTSSTTLPSGLSSLATSTNGANGHVNGSVNGLSVNGYTTPAGLVDSTNASPRTPAPPAKVYSKWEKQELEARAMMKMREANRKKEVERETKQRAEREAKEAKERAERELREKLEREAKEAREKAEREAKERAEKEKKEKEEKEKAAAASVPTISVTAASTPAASTGVPNFFGQPKAETPAAPTTTAAAAPQPAGSTPSFFSFPSKAAAAPTAPAAPATSSFSFGGPPASSVAGPTASATKDAAASSSGPSLLSRLGSQQSAPEAPKTGSSNPLFSFAKPAEPAAATAPPPPVAAAVSSGPKFTFNFGGGKPATGTTAAPAATPAAAPSANPFAAPAADASKAVSNPTFNFKTPGAPASATAPGATATTATNGASKFSFGGSATGTTSAFGAPKDAKNPFGGSSAPSAFGGSTTPAPSPFGAPSSTTTAAAPAISPFGPTALAAAKGGSAFGSTTPASTPSGSSSAFGAASAATLFGPGASTTTPKADPAAKSTFSFGPSTSSTTPSGAPKTASAFGFGTPASSATSTTGAAAATPSGTSTTPAATPGAGFSFKFAPTTPAGGATSAFGSTTPFGTPANGAGTSVFGSSTTPSTTTTGAPPSVFGSAFGAK